MNRLKKLFIEESYFFKAVPALVWQFLFFYIPIGFVLALSFVKSGTFEFTLKNYDIIFNGVYLKIILNSFILASITTLLCLLVGYPIAYFIAIKKRSLKNIFLFLMILPFWTNFLVLTYAWYFVLDRDGLLNNILLRIGLLSGPLALLNNYGAVILVMFYAYLPFMVMPLFSTLEKFDITLIDASKDLGATMRQTFFHIVFPSSISGIKTGFLLVFVPAFGEFVIPMLVGGDKNMYVGTLISHYFFIGQDQARGAAFTVISSIVLFLILMLFMGIFRPPRKARAMPC